jgi:hypothetical protein
VVVGRAGDRRRRRPLLVGRGGRDVGVGGRPGAGRQRLVLRRTVERRRVRRRRHLLRGWHRLGASPYRCDGVTGGKTLWQQPPAGCPGSRENIIRSARTADTAVARGKRDNSTPRRALVCHGRVGRVFGRFTGAADLLAAAGREDADAPGSPGGQFLTPRPPPWAGEGPGVRVPFVLGFRRLSRPTKKGPRPPHPNPLPLKAAGEGTKPATRVHDAKQSLSASAIPSRSLGSRGKPTCSARHFPDG